MNLPPSHMFPEKSRESATNNSDFGEAFLDDKKWEPRKPLGLPKAHLFCIPTLFRAHDRNFSKHSIVFVIGPRSEKQLV